MKNTKNENQTHLEVFGMSGETVERCLAFVRQHLGMDIAYLSEFVDDLSMIKAVEANDASTVSKPGDTHPLNQTYCQHVVRGELPELLCDTHDYPIAKALPATKLLPIRAYIGVPIKRTDGSVYGMFCCVSKQPNKSLNDRDLSVMKMFASIAADQVNASLDEQIAEEAKTQIIRNIIDTEDMDVVYQPIMDIEAGYPKGFEALCRFRAEPYRPPNQWFDVAKSINLGTELEISVIRKALTALNDLPNDVYISVNASAETVQSGRLRDVFEGYPHGRIVVEITEHEAIADYDCLRRELEILRFSGVRVAVDDAGSGYSGLEHIVRIKPDILKLDISLTSRIDKDIVKRSMAAALSGFATEINSVLVAEGVETQGELEALCDLNVPYAQGYLLGRPESLDTALSWFSNNSRTVA